MPGIGWSEMLLLAVVAILVVGPKDLPRLMRVVGHWLGKARAAAREFQQAFDDLARESEMEDMRRQMEEMRQQAAATDLGDDGGWEPAPAAQSGKGGNGTRPAAAQSGDEAAPSGGEKPAAAPEKRSVPSH
jgi:sec-independent protein translocase protein TatB